MTELAPDRSLLALEDQVCFALAVASRSVIALYRPVLEPLGLTHPQYLVMLALWDRDPRTVRDLGEALELDPATLSPLLKRLEASGYITRTRNPVDERALDVRLTRVGRDLKAEAEQIPHRIIERLNMPLDELETLRSGLHRVIRAATTPSPSAS